MSKLKIKGAKARAWKAFSLYIRTKYSIDGICTCYTCLKPFEIKNIQCGHGVGGRSNGILLVEEACRPQCYGCNVAQHGRYDVFIPKLIELYGLDGYNDLVKLKNAPKKMSIDGWLEQETYYKQAIEDLT